MGRGLNLILIVGIEFGGWWVCGFGGGRGLHAWMADGVGAGMVWDLRVGRVYR